jgi:hypothetical protein
MTAPGSIASGPLDVVPRKEPMPEPVAPHPEAAGAAEPPMPFSSPDGAAPPMPSEVTNVRQRKQRPTPDNRWHLAMEPLRKMMHRSPRGTA